MGDPVAANIMKTGAVLWYAPVGESLPDETAIGAGVAWGDNWTRVGFTKAPVKMKYDVKTTEIEVEEFLGPIDRYRIGESVTIETELAELTAEYMALMGGGTPSETPADVGQVGYEELGVGNQPRITKYQYGFEGIRFDALNNSLPVRIFFTRATAVFGGELEFSQKTDGYPGIPVSISALADLDASPSGRMFLWQRVTAPASEA
jgi:hypothetical protein